MDKEGQFFFPNHFLDGTEDDAVWDDEEEDTEDAEEPVDNKFETDSEAENDGQLSSAMHSIKKGSFQNHPSSFQNQQIRKSQ